MNTTQSLKAVATVEVIGAGAIPAGGITAGKIKADGCASAGTIPARAAGEVVVTVGTTADAGMTLDAGAALARPSS
ncbi:MAG: hypothetical protein ABI895_08825 [Deltaproteobacteria bacterium]